MSLGFVLYGGPSRINGAPIVVVATLTSENHKTGNMIQTWILSASEKPHQALQSGADDAVCGDCPLRPANSGGCYVATHQAPLQVYVNWKAGKYPKLDLRLRSHRSAFRNRIVRIGAYGDPAAVPIDVFDGVLKYAAGHTGYTHQWARFPEYSRLLMASVHTEFEAQCAADLGWRTFRIRTADQPVLPTEVVCPASDEAGKSRTCLECGGCNGRRNMQDRRRSFVIVNHGRKRHRAALVSQ